MSQQLQETQDEDRRRVVEIDRYQVLVDPPRSDLVALVDVAAQVADVPLTTINLITDAELFQVATKGFYATHQLTTPGGVVIGTLCVFDTVPRDLTDDQERALVELAERVVDLLELELRTRELASTVDDLERARDELQRSNSQLAAFAGQVSHDLRNPLTTVRMSLSMLAEEAVEGQGSPGGSAFLLGRAEKGAERMQALIDDLLAYARIGGQIARRPVDLAAVLAEVRDDLAGALGGASLEVEDLPVVTGDPVQLRAVLQNLLANAAKFVPPGESARIRVRARRHEAGWLVEVVDRGLGVAPQDRDRVFEPLARAHDDVPGSGIGLATVRRIIAAHGGTIGIEETPGGGATVWFVLPGEAS